MARLRNTNNDKSSKNSDYQNVIDNVEDIDNVDETAHIDKDEVNNYEESKINESYDSSYNDEGLYSEVSYEENVIDNEVKDDKKGFDFLKLLSILCIVLALVFGAWFIKDYKDVSDHNKKIAQEEQHAVDNINDILDGIEVSTSDGKNDGKQKLKEIKPDKKNPTSSTDELGLKDGSGQVRSDVDHSNEKEKIEQPSNNNDDGDLSNYSVRSPEDSNSMRSIFDRNPNMNGWLTVGHVISVPVMQLENDSLDDPYYLKRDSNGDFSEWGTPYMDSESKLGQSRNTPIYGHSGMTYGKTMFSPLMQFNFDSIATPNKDISITTREGVYHYEIVYNYKSATWDSDGIPINSVNLSDEDFSQMIDNIDSKSKSFYKNPNVSVDEVKASRIITLITCDVPYDAYTGRNFTIAREVGFTPAE